jgi:hypothetical protein
MEPSQDDGCESTSFSISDKAQGKLISIANRKIIERERGKIDTHNTKIHDRSLSRIGTSTSVKKKGGGVSNN